MATKKAKLHKQRNPFVVEMLKRGHQVHDKPQKTLRRKAKQQLKANGVEE